ncbi:MAG: MFS transporter [Planctomycetaceae bacterium]|nr:MFS transporter [Planctomycetaceae bacterium]
MTIANCKLDSARWSQLALLAAVELLAMSLWFSASSVTQALQTSWNLSRGAESWLTISVQLGFVLGALASAVLNLSERISPPRLLAACAMVGAALNAAIPLLISDTFGRTTGGFAALVALRMATGVMLAGVYPTGMKLLATWFKQGRGLAIGVLVGALTLGSASPHLLAGLAHWRTVMYGCSVAALLAGLLAAATAQVGPHLPTATRFDWGYFARVWADPAVRRANFGYLGHMFELYAMWTWAPRLLRESYTAHSYSLSAAAAAGFAVVAIGGLGCVLAGLTADRAGRCWTTIASLVVSGSCALAAGWLADQPLLLTAVCLIWGFAVVADSAQFSAAVSELCDPQFVGTALTIQTCAGFLLTTLTIRAVPEVQATHGWGWAFAMLALGPVFGVFHMARLRASDAATKMAGGRR